MTMGFKKKTYFTSLIISFIAGISEKYHVANKKTLASSLKSTWPMTSYRIDGFQGIHNVFGDQIKHMELVITRVHVRRLVDLYESTWNANDK